VKHRPTDLFKSCVMAKLKCIKKYKSALSFFMEDKGYHNEWETLNAGEDVKEVSQLVMKKKNYKIFIE